VTAVLEELVKSPRLPAYVSQLNDVLAKEQERRRRFYDELTEDVTAEFINGQVVMQSPATYAHSQAVKLLAKLLDTYVERHQLGWVGLEKVLICLPRNDYEPDVCFFGPAKAALLQPGQLKFPPPDFIAEVVSPATESRDRGVKFEDYAANGVQEYWLIDPVAEEAEPCLLREGQYTSAGRIRQGELRSTVVSGFVIPVRAIFDPQVNLATLRQLLAG